MTIDLTQIYCLGLTLDNKLQWNKHELEVINNTKKILMLCRNIASKNWKCNPKALLWIYAVGLIIAYQCYPQVALSKTNNLVYTRINLSKVQILICLRIIGAIDLTFLHIVVEFYRV